MNSEKLIYHSRATQNTRLWRSDDACRDESMRDFK